MSDELPTPHDGMTPKEKGELLLRYVDSMSCVANVDFSAAGLVKAELAYANIEGANLESADMRGADLFRANLTDANLRESRLSRAFLAGVDLTGANLLQAVLTDTNLFAADLSGANLQRSNLTRAKAQGACFANSKLCNAQLDRADLSEADLTLSDLRRASLFRANLDNALLDDSRLAMAALRRATLEGASITRADLRGSSMRNTNLYQANLSNSDLRYADLRGANLRHATLVGVKLSGAQLEGAVFTVAQFADVDEHLLRTLWLAGCGLPQLPQWSNHMRQSIIGTTTGLTLYFNTRLTRVDRWLVDGFPISVLGPDTDVEIADIHRSNESTTVRLSGSNQADLEAVANALYERAWEDMERNALSRFQETMTASMRAALSDMVVHRLDRIELRLPSKKAVSALEDVADERQALELLFKLDNASRPDVALARLLLELFPDGESLRDRLQGGMSTTALTALVPAGSASPGLVAVGAARALADADAVQGFLGELAEEAPGRAEDIEAVLVKWRSA